MYKFDDDEFLTIPEAAQYLNVTEDTVHGFVGYCYIYCSHWALVWPFLRGDQVRVRKAERMYLKGIGRLERGESFGMLATRDQRWHDNHSDNPGLPCVPRRWNVNVTPTPYITCDGKHPRHITNQTTFAIDDYLSAIVESGLFSIKDLDHLAIQHGFEQQHISSISAKTADTKETPEKKARFYINEPTKKDDWFYAIKECAEHFVDEYSRLPTEAELWLRMFSNPPPNYPITIDDWLGHDRKPVLELTGGPDLTRDAFRKRYKNYFPRKTT